MKLVLIVIINLSIGFRCSNGARILGVFPLNSKSHSIMINAIVKELTVRGHQVSANNLKRQIRLISIEFMSIAGRHNSLSTAQEYAKLQGNRSLARLRLLARP